MYCLHTYNASVTNIWSLDTLYFSCDVVNMVTSTIFQLSAVHTTIPRPWQTTLTVCAYHSNMLYRDETNASDYATTCISRTSNCILVYLFLRTIVARPAMVNCHYVVLFKLHINRRCICSIDYNTNVIDQFKC